MQRNAISAASAPLLSLGTDGSEVVDLPYAFLLQGASNKFLHCNPVQSQLKIGSISAGGSKVESKPWVLNDSQCLLDLVTISTQNKHFSLS